MMNALSFSAIKRFYDAAASDSRIDAQTFYAAQKAVRL
jgi:hypothetical protein